MRRLTEKTVAGELSWQHTALADSFLVFTDRAGYGISFDRVDDVGDGVPMDWYEFALLTTDGRPVEEYSTAPGLSANAVEEWAGPELRELFIAARRSAGDADELLERALADLAG